MNELVRVVVKEAKWQLTLNSVKQDMGNKRTGYVIRRYRECEPKSSSVRYHFDILIPRQKEKVLDLPFPVQFVGRWGQNFSMLQSAISVVQESGFTMWPLCGQSSIPSINADENRSDF